MKKLMSITPLLAAILIVSVSTAHADSSSFNARGIDRQNASGRWSTRVTPV